MIGTWINITTVLLGGSIGLLFGGRLPERMRHTVVAGLGLFTFALGVFMFIKTANPIVVLGSLLVGGLLGEWWHIEAGLMRLGEILEYKVARRVFSFRQNDQPFNLSKRANDDETQPSTRFVRGFLTASLVFCVGPMTILGSIQDGLTGDYNLLAIKSVLDGFAALAFASTLGPGVLFSILVIFIYQGGLTVLASQAQAWISQAMMVEMSASGGVLLMGIAVSSLLEIKPVRVGNFLPALAVAPIIVAIVDRF